VVDLLQQLRVLLNQLVEQDYLVFDLQACVIRPEEVGILLLQFLPH
jgi:hypothetical protein